MYRLIAVALISLLAVGCGSGLETAPVTGKVTLDGEPLEGVSVTFTPRASGGEAPASNGITDAEGNYTLTVTATGDDGAVLGDHIVTIAAIGEERTGEDADVIDPNAEDPIPDHNLSVEVTAGNNTANFDLSSDGGSGYEGEDDDDGYGADDGFDG